MASAFTHGFFAYTIGKVGFSKQVAFKAFFIAIVLSALPDADVIAFKLGIPYESPFGHRGFTHSIFFAALFAALIVKLFYWSLSIADRQWKMLFLFFFLSMASHGVLDAITNGGMGIAFFWPFSEERFFFPFRPVQSSPLSVARFFSKWGVAVMKSEFIWVWIPCIFLLIINTFIRKETRPL